MTINIPCNFLPERTYIIDIIFKEFLGLEYQINVLNIKDYEIILQNANKLIIKDSFFLNFQEVPGYLNMKNLPAKVEFLKNPFLVEEDIPVIFGNDELAISEKEIICGIDIFSSSFFMLTRWEEYVNKIGDRHNRFLSVASTAFKSNFLNRPVVNEYIEMLWNMLQFLGCKQKRKKRSFNMILTHDIEMPLRFAEFKSFLKIFRVDLLKSFFQAKFGSKRNPFNTFNYIMTTSERLNLRSYFFFMAAQKSKYDQGYSLENEFIKNIMKEIIDRGHIIGFHSGYYTYNDGNLFKKEYEYLSKHLPKPASCGRQHFLRFEIPGTWQIWEDNNMEWDSTLSYADYAGFRCGSCYEFSVFNILTRQKLKLKERPLIAMDTTFANYQKMLPQGMKDEIKYLVDKVKIYNGNFVFLWHNSSFNTIHWRPFQHVYEEVLRA